MLAVTHSTDPSQSLEGEMDLSDTHSCHLLGAYMRELGPDVPPQCLAQPTLELDSISISTNSAHAYPCRLLLQRGCSLVPSMR